MHEKIWIEAKIKNVVLIISPHSCRLINTFEKNWVETKIK